MTIEELKALAYDQLVEQSRVTKNLQIIEARIVELSKQPDVKDKSNKNK